MTIYDPLFREIQEVFISLLLLGAFSLFFFLSLSHVASEKGFPDFFSVNCPSPSEFPFPLSKPTRGTFRCLPD